MRSLLLFLAAGCGDVTINVNEKDDTGSAPDSGGTGGDTDTDTDADTDTDTDTDSGWAHGGAWSAGEAAEVLSVSGSVRGAWLRDANDDGHLDLLLFVEDYAAGDAAFLKAIVYPGDGAGHFGSPTITSGSVPMSMSGPVPDLGDLNQDGHPDIVRSVNGEFRVFFGNGKGFDAPVAFTGPDWISVSDVKVTDVDGDGGDDLIVGHFGSTTATGVLDLTVERWNGSDFESAAELGVPSTSGGSYSYGTVLQDAVSVNADGVRFTAMPGAYTDFSGQLFLNGILAFSDAGVTQYQVGNFSWRFSGDLWTAGEVVDVNGDGADDVVSQGYDGVQWTTPASTDRPHLVTAASSTSLGATLDVQDINGDGHADVTELLYIYHEGDDHQILGIGTVLGDGSGFGDEVQFETTYPVGYSALMPVGDVVEDGCGDVILFTGDTAQTVTLIPGRCGG